MWKGAFVLEISFEDGQGLDALSYPRFHRGDLREVYVDVKGVIVLPKSVCLLACESDNLL